MTAPSDVVAVCAQFQQNFAELEVRYNTLQLKHVAEVDRNAKLKKQLDVSVSTVEKLEAGVKEVREELSEAQQYRERFNNATVMIEQLRGRIETSRKDVADTIMSHQHEVAQLRSQSQDLLRRIECSGDTAQINNLRTQQREMEERCAVINSQRLEEKERHEQIIITAHSALRDVQSRNLQLEQRCRAAEHEVSQMKAALRRSLTLQNDAAALADKSQSEVVRMEDESKSMRNQINELHGKLHQTQLQAEESVASIKQHGDDEKSHLLQKISSLSGKLDDAIAQHVVDNDKYHALQRTIQRKVSIVREECQQELDNLYTAKAEEKDENQRVQWHVKQLELQLSDAKVATAQAEGRVVGLEASRHQLQTQLEKVVQSESWAAAERDRLLNQVGMLQQRSEEGSVIAKELDAALLEMEKMRMEIRYRDADLIDAKRQVDQAVLRSRAMESTCQQKTDDMYRQLKEMRKHCKQSLARSEEVRKKLTSSLMHKEAELASHAKVTGTSLLGGELPTTVDVLTLLKAQSADASALQGRIASLSHR